MRQNRRAKFVRLCAERFKDDRSKIMVAIGLTNGRITQLLDPDETFGELAGKRIAAKLGLPLDYFERDGDEHLGAIPGLDSELALGQSDPRPDVGSDKEETLMQDKEVVWSLYSRLEPAHREKILMEMVALGGTEPREESASKKTAGGS